MNSVKFQGSPLELHALLIRSLNIPLLNTGKFCERFRFKGQYKPLSQRMLEEPFWLGLIAIGSVIILISFAYCLKKMFAEKIEQFFTEEIEKAKYMRELSVCSLYF